MELQLSNGFRITNRIDKLNSEITDSRQQIVLIDNERKDKIKTLDISSLPSSIYLISVKDDQGNVAVEKVVKK